MWPNFFKKRVETTQTPRPTKVLPEAPDVVLRRLQWTVLRPLATYLGGDELSRQRGPGMELTEVREYQPGDDIRFIDWNITARTEQPYIRESHVDRALDVWFVLDLSASIQWGTARCLKIDHTLDFVGVAGQVLQRNGNRLGAVLFADRPLHIVPPATGRLHLMHLLTQLREKAQGQARGKTDIAAALNSASTVIPRRSLVIVVSDFLIEDNWSATLGKLAQRHDVVAVRLCDPREQELPDVGLVTLEDPETGQQLYIDTSDARLRQRFQAAAVAQSERITASLTRYGIDQLQLSTEEELLPAFIRFLRIRKLRRVRGGKRATQIAM